MMVSIWWVVGALLLGVMGGILFRPRPMTAREERIHYGINEPPPQVLPADGALTLAHKKTAGKRKPAPAKNPPRRPRPPKPRSLGR